MEQKKPHYTWLLWIGAACVACLLSACRAPIPNPESLDPIYADLLAQAGVLRGKAEAQKKKIEDLSVKIEKYGPRDPELKATIHQRENLERGMVQLDQEAQYFEIRAEQRRIYDKESYMKAYKAEKDQEWPDPQEFVEYKQSNKLKMSSRDWSKSVPVDTSHNRPVVDKKKKKEEKKEE